MVYLKVLALGPLLFLIYINDLPKCLEHATASMFADDTQIETSSNDVSVMKHELNHDLEMFRLGCQQTN